MKVKAKHWLNVDGEWHPAGEPFEVESIAGFEESVEVIAEAKSEPKPEKTEVKPAQTRRKSRTGTK